MSVYYSQHVIFGVKLSNDKIIFENDQYHLMGCSHEEKWELLEDVCRKFDLAYCPSGSREEFFIVGFDLALERKDVTGNADMVRGKIDPGQISEMLQKADDIGLTEMGDLYIYTEWWAG